MRAAPLRGALIPWCPPLLPDQAGCLQRPVKAKPLRGGLPAWTARLRQLEFFVGGESRKRSCTDRGVLDQLDLPVPALRYRYKVAREMCRVRQMSAMALVLSW